MYIYLSVRNALPNDASESSQGIIYIPSILSVQTFL